MRRAVTVLLVAHSLMAVLILARNFSWKFVEARGYWKDDEAAARRRLYGDEYAAGLERAIEAVPRSGSYRLVDGSGSAGDGVFIRWELAPRRALLSGDPREIEAPIPGEVVRTASATVVARPGKPPQVLHPELSEGRAPAGMEGPGDEGIPAAVDKPRAGDPAVSDLRVEGWCQERGGRPCEAVRFFVDGEEVLPRTFERYARPDVERAVEGIGDASRAGYRAQLPIPAATLPARSLSVLFVTPDGRWRIVGPLELVGAP